MDTLQTFSCSSPIGTLTIAGSDKGIRALRLGDAKTGAATAFLPDWAQPCKQQLDEFFLGKRTTFDLDLDWSDTSEFYQKVWLELLQIPYGKTTTYGALAKKIGNPNASRAVGLANGRNPIAVIVPCHRVIGSNGNLTGYAYGLDIKKQLLALENPTLLTLF